MFPIYRHGAFIKGCLVDERQYWCNLRSLSGIASGPVALWGLTASMNFLTPVSHTVISGKTLYLQVPRFGTLILPPFVKTDENLVLRISALVWLSLWTMPFFLSGTTPLLSFFLLLMKDQTFCRLPPFWLLSPLMELMY